MTEEEDLMGRSVCGAWRGRYERTADSTEYQTGASMSTAMAKGLFCSLFSAGFSYVVLSS